jgi:CRISPR-associated endoribonuclease Cas6
VAIDFFVEAFRFEGEATDDIVFPYGKAGNAFRGAFGIALKHLCCAPTCRDASGCSQRSECLYPRIFEPVADDGPSGLADRPRPFVLRASHLDGRRIEAGGRLTFDLHLFDAGAELFVVILQAITRVFCDGIGAGRGRGRLLKVHRLQRNREPGELVFDDGSVCGELKPKPFRIQESPRPGVEQIRIDFLTPTEIKHNGEILRQPEFGPLIARLRDRYASLRQFYQGRGPDMAFKEMAELARNVRTVRIETQWARVNRWSSRSGQTHPLDGFVGWAEYAGELSPFLGLLEVGYWSGVGRQTVWGKGAIRSEF